MVYNKFVITTSYLVLGILAVILLGACQQTGQDSGEFTVTVDVDGVSRVYRYDKRISVGQFLQEIDVTLGELDEVNPLLQTQLRDGMRITVTRVTQREECEDEVLPYETERQFTQVLAPGEEQIAQTGENGTIQVCYRITERDGVQAGRVEISRIPIDPPRNEIIYVGSEPPETLIPIEGVLTYISGGQAWIIEGNTANLRPLTTEGFLDGRVFDLSANGLQLLYSIRTEDEDDPEFSNELWAVLDTGAAVPEAVQLVPSDVRIAQWVSGQPPITVSYSTANPSTDGAGWRAYNDLYLMQLDPETGEALDVEEVIAANALGTYPWWGRRYLWSSDGTQLAWAMADSVGTVNLETGDYLTLATFSEYAPLLERFQGSTVWVPTLSWSEDGHLITTVHGAPYGEELPENSIIFDLAVIDVERDLQINPFFTQSGIWATPTYSPVIEVPDGGLAYSFAYFQAREPLNSLGAQYNLVVADRDGSNARVLFPEAGKQGLRPDPEDGIAWSPMGRQIALIYQGNLWIVDVETGLAHQITSDGQASRPRWSRTR
jgi:hypothetical protein